MAAKVNWNGVEAAIRSAEAAGTRVGVAAIAPSGERFGHNAGQRFAAASTIKICIMIELFRQIDAGRHVLADHWPMHAADRANGSGVMRHLHAGIEFTLNDLCYLMMSISDNTATNMLIDIVGGMEPVNATMRELGMTQSVLGRKMGQFNLGPAHENYAVPDEFADVIGAILGNRAASAGSCAAMVAMLEKQQNDRRIARHLPKQDGPRWGTKTGSMSGVTNDVGFIMTAGGPLIVSVYTADQPDRNLAEAQIGDIARAALEASS